MRIREGGFAQDHLEMVWQTQGAYLVGLLSILYIEDVSWI